MNMSAIRQIRFLKPGLLFLTTLLLTTFARADLSLGGGSDDEFLPVEQAYQVLVELTDTGITMNWNLAPGYYLYQHQFKLEAGNGSESESLSLKFEPGKRKFDEYFNKELEVYYYNTLVSSGLPAMAPPYELKLTSQGCADAGLCYPPRRQYFQVDADGIVTELEASNLGKTPTVSPASSISGNAPVSSSQTTPAAPEEAPFLPAILFGALLGGLILNLMPCVFPVLSLKALSFASSHQSGHMQHAHGWAYTVGVVLSFLVAALVILLARGAGEMLGWGFQLQHPVFVAGLAYLFLIMGLSLYGMFHFGTQLMGAGQELTTGSGIRASFFTGVLAAVVASPCTAPFMATALGVALTQPMAVALLIFATLGFGMALPFLLLSYSPKLADYLPRPGPWMEILKQALAFPLLATCIWLLWVVGHQTGSNGTALVLSGALLICFALWLLRFQPASTGGRLSLRALTVVSLLAAAHLTWQVQLFKVEGGHGGSHERWEAYSPARLDELRAAGKPVFVNLTADWCITCKVNERVAFSSDTFFTRADDLGVTLMIGDWTNPNDDIADLLKRYDRSGIPLYLVFPAAAGAEPEILPQLLTVSSVVDALERATAK